VSGYVRIHRSLIGHPAFRNDAEAMAFAWLVARAAWQLTKVRYKGRDYILDRGQLSVSIRDFADKMDRPKGWVERLFARLVEHGMIVKKSGTQVGTQVGTHGGTVGGTPPDLITICNYEEYQARGLRSETLDETFRETGAGHAQDTEQVSEEGKEDKSEAIASVSPRQPLSDALSIWNVNAAAAGWPLAKGLTAERPKHLRNRLRENGLEGFRAAIIRARASPYLGGADPPSWFTFDWLIKAANFQKVIEGNYDRRHTADNTDPTTTALQRILGPGANG
jgi:hypothetical protein